MSSLDLVILCPTGDMTGSRHFLRDRWTILRTQLAKVLVSVPTCDADEQTLSEEQLYQLAAGIESYLSSSHRGPGGFRSWITGLDHIFRQLARQGGAKVFTSYAAYESARLQQLATEAVFRTVSGPPTNEQPPH